MSRRLRHRLIRVVLPGVPILNLAGAIFLHLQLRLVALLLVVTAEVPLALFAYHFSGRQTHRSEQPVDEITSGVSAADRQRMARDLHDEVGNDLAIISLYARGGHGPDDLHVIDETARHALRGLSRIIRSLRSGVPPAGAEADVSLFDEVRTVIRQLVPFGLEADLVTTGRADALPPAVRQVVSRVVREALVNALKHSATPRARVSLRVSEDLTVCIETPAVPPVCGPRIGGGLGLQGISELVQQYGGGLQAGRRGERYQVRACIPLVWNRRRPVTTAA
jgi:signal transduction histidine kinase